MMADKSRSSQQELSKDFKKDTLGFRRTTISQRITENDLQTEIMRRIYRRIAINSSLENYSRTDVGDTEVYRKNRDCPESDSQSNGKF